MKLFSHIFDNVVPLNEGQIELLHFRSHSLASFFVYIHIYVHIINEYIYVYCLYISKEVNASVFHFPCKINFRFQFNQRSLPVLCPDISARYWIFVKRSV